MGRHSSELARPTSEKRHSDLSRKHSDSSRHSERTLPDKPAIHSTNLGKPEKFSFAKPEKPQMDKVLAKNERNSAKSDTTSTEGDKSAKNDNYIGSIDVCGNGLLEGGCMTPERLAKHKDEQIAKSLERVKSSVDYWDSSKCPPVRTYMQNIGLIPADDEDTSSANSVGARFGGTEEKEEDGSDDEAQAL